METQLHIDLLKIKFNYVIFIKYVYRSKVL